MKVITQTRAQLVLEDRPWLFAGFLWAITAAMIRAAIVGDVEAGDHPVWLAQMLLLGLSAGTMTIAWIFFPFQRFTFDSARGEFVHRTTRPFSVRTTLIPLERIDRAKLEKSWGESTWMERAVLVQNEGVIHPLETGFVGVPRQEVVDSINEWLDVATLDITQLG